MNFNKGFIWFAVIVLIIGSLFITLFENQKLNKQSIIYEENLDSLAQLTVTFQNALNALLVNNFEQASKHFITIDSTSKNNNNWKNKYFTYLNFIAETNDSIKQLSTQNNILWQSWQTKKLAEINLNQLTDSLTHETNSITNELTQLQLINKKQAQFIDSILNLNLQYLPLYFEVSNDNNVRYFGQVENNKANGKGLGVYETGGIYQGNWKNNQRHGLGIYYWANGDIFNGNFVNDSRQGFGSYTFATGEKYVGNWQNDLREGYGLFISATGDTLLNGNWQNDKFLRKK